MRERNMRDGQWINETNKIQQQYNQQQQKQQSDEYNNDVEQEAATWNMFV